MDRAATEELGRADTWVGPYKRSPSPRHHKVSLDKTAPVSDNRTIPFARPNPLDKKEFGAKGEALAEQRLKRLGYKILDRNFTTRSGEIDIIAKDGDTVVFVEVKTRRDASFAAPELSVGPTKRGRMQKAALMYMIKNRLENTPCRFDVVGISAGEGGPVVDVIKDAFELSGGY